MASRSCGGIPLGIGRQRANGLYALAEREHTAMGIDRFAYTLRLLGIRQRVCRDQPLHHAARLGYRHQQERMRGKGQQFRAS